jgi:Immunity protein 53
MSISTLEEWYSRQCNGEWEHGPGVRISTIDNPGWSVDIPLRGTRKETTTLERIKIDRGHDNWIHYWVEKQNFQIRCGPLNLSEAIEIFSEWFNTD